MRNMSSGKALLEHLHSENIDIPVAKKDEPKKCTGSECSPRTDFISTVLCLIYWHDVRLSLAVLTCLFLLQLALVLYPVLHVVSVLCLSVLTVNFTFCCRYGFAGILQQSNRPHPFRKYLDRDILVSQDAVYGLADSLVMSVISTMSHAKQLIFLKDLKSSLKFYAFLWALVPFGIWFSNMFIILLCTIGLFTLPKFYERYKIQVDKFTVSAERRLNQMFGW